jgi:hypothetical protein
MTEANIVGREAQATQIRITVIIQNRFLLDSTVVTGRGIKETASIPDGFSLHHRIQGGGNEAVADDESVEVHNGDHFYAQPLSQPGVGHRGES